MRQLCLANRMPSWRHIVLNDENKNGIGLSFAINGIKEAWKRELNFRIHIIVAAFVIGACIIFPLTTLEILIIFIMIYIVLITELMNSIVERLIDYLQPEWHQKAKIIKDMAAAMVLISAFTSIVIGLIIFMPKLLKLVQ